MNESYSGVAEERPRRSPKQCGPSDAYSWSFSATRISLLLCAVLLLVGIVLDSGSTPQEVLYADVVFVALSFAILLVMQRRYLGLTLALMMGLVFVFRSIGDPDLEAIFEEGNLNLVQAKVLLILVAFSLILLLSSYGAVLLYRTSHRGKDLEQGGIVKT